MGFKLITSNENGTETIQIRSASSQVMILPKVGALLQSYGVNYGNIFFNCIDGLKKLNLAFEEVKEWYRGAKLSPFPARILEGKFKFENNIYEFDNRFPDGSAIHGLLFNKSFEIINQSILENEATVELLHCYRGEDKGFPFHYDCYVNYTLNDQNVLTITTTIVNEDVMEIPIADGWHPYFNLSGKVDDWNLKINSDKKLVLNEQLVPNGDTIDSNMMEPVSLQTKNMDDCFIINNKNITAILNNPINGWSIDFSFMANYPFLQVFIPEHRNSIAIEPFSGAPNCFNNEIGLIKLAVADKISFTWSMHLKHTEEKYL